MLEGLEVSVLNFLEVKKSSYSERFDSFFFKREFLKKSFSKKVIELNQICSIKSGTTPPQRDENLKKGIILLKTDNIRNGVLSFSGEKDFFYIDEDTNHKMKATELNVDDVLINIVGATTEVIGRCSLLSSDFPKANITQAMACLRIKEEFLPTFNSYYLFAFIISRLGHKQVRRIARPTGQFNMNLQEVGSIEIPIASISFQSEIKTIIIKSENHKRESLRLYSIADHILSESLNIEQLDQTHNLSNVKRYSASFLTTGRLDAEYYQKKFDDLEDKIMKTGRGTKLGSVLTFNKRGTQPIYAEHGKGLPVLNSKHIRENRIDFLDNRFGDPTEAKKELIIRKNDVLINGTGVGTIGRSAVYLKEEPALPDNHVTILRTESIDPVFLAVMLNSNIGKMQVEKYFKGSSGQIELYPADINEFIIWKAPVHLQREVRKKIEKAEKLKNQSLQLLDTAKRAVEIAIEQDETTALTFINKSKL